MPATHSTHTPPSLLLPSTSLARSTQFPHFFVLQFIFIVFASFGHRRDFVCFDLISSCFWNIDTLTQATTTTTSYVVASVRCIPCSQMHHVPGQAGEGANERKIHPSQLSCWSISLFKLTERRWPRQSLAFKLCEDFFVLLAFFNHLSRCWTLDAWQSFKVDGDQE